MRMYMSSTFVFFKQKTAYEMRISDWSSDVCSSDLIALGRALQDLGDASLLLIGSGFSFHNMQAFFTPETGETKTMNQSFERWLLDTCSDRQLSEDERKIGRGSCRERVGQNV